MATSSPPVDQFEVKGKVALVTGAASGIGLAVTKSLLKKGAKVCMADINFIKVDVTVTKELAKVFVKTKETYGSLDIVCNNAGMDGGEDNWRRMFEVNVVCMVDINGQKSLSAAGFQKEFPAENVFFAKVDISDAKQLTEMFAKTTETFGGLDIDAGIVNGEKIWRKMFEVNVFFIIESISLAIEHMSTAKGGKGGVVVNTASILGLFPKPGLSMYFAKYSATKHAVIGYTRIYKEVARTDGIRVNCVCPGAVDTPLLRSVVEMQPPVLDQKVAEFVLTHFLSPEKVAEGVLELITDTSKAGAAMAITYNKGFTYPELLDNAKFES